MKNTTIIITILLIFSLNTFAQTPSGKYTRNTVEYLNFMPENRIDFFLKGPGCFGEEIMTGMGYYILNKDRLIINFQTHNKKFESKFKQVSTNDKGGNSDYEFFINDEENIPIPFANITYINSKNEHKGATTDINGFAKLSIPDSLNTELKISFIGYTSAFIPLIEIRPGKIEVTLKKGNTIFLDNSKIKMKLTLDEKNKTFKIKKIKIK